MDHSTVPRSCGLAWFVALAAFLPSAAAPGQHRVVWDETWEATGAERWVPVPVGTWPTDNGELLVRLAYTHGVRAHQLIAGDRKPPSEPKDYLIEVDTIERLAREAHRPPGWSWWAEGAGRVRVQIIWFDKKRDAKRWRDDHPYEHEFAPSVLVAPPPPPVAEPHPGIPGADPFQGLVTLVWEHVGDATEPPQWVTGPGRTWDPRRGVLLLRAAGGPHFRGLVWRAGPGGAPRELPRGDHLLDADVLERPSTNPFEVLLGGGAQSESFHFGLIGQGPARIQLCWLARPDLAQAWCAANPIGVGGPPPAPLPAPGAPAAGFPPPPPPGSPPPRPDPRFDPRTAPGYVSVRFSGSLVDEASGRPLPDIDVVIQLLTAPRTIYGGGRTDRDGRYDFTLSVPSLTPLVIRIPERGVESQARSIERPDEAVEFSVRLR